MHKQSHSNDQNVSMEPILQDFSINSLSEISSGVLNPSDTTIYEEIKGFDVALPSVTLNNTEDINLSSGPYPSDSTMIDISKGATPSQVFKKPFFNRQKPKPRPSLFDLDGEDFSQDTPEQKIHHPFVRKSRKKLNSTLFDLESSNENINNSNVISNFITRRTLRSKRNVDNSLFDKALETSESDQSFSNKPMFRISKKNSKEVNASVFKDVFDDSLNLSNIDKSVTNNQKQCFNNVKKHVDSAIFDSVFNSSASPDKSYNVTLEKDKEESISACTDNSESSCENIVENCEISDQTENKNTYCNSGTSTSIEYKCEENSNELVEENNMTYTKENTLNLVKSTDEEKKLEQIQQHENIIGSKIADVNNQNNSRCSVLVETAEDETNFTNHKLNENYVNKENSNVTFSENQQMINTIGENVISVISAVAALAETKLDFSDSQQIQQHEKIIGSKIADINNKNNSSSVLVETVEDKTNFTNHKQNENYENKENSKVTFSDKQQTNTIGKNMIPVIGAVEVFVETKLDCSNSPKYLEKSVSNFPNMLHSNDMQSSEETHNLTNTSISHSFNKYVSVETVNTINLKDNLHDVSGNKSQTKNIAINQAMPTHQEGEINESYSNQFEKQHPAKDFSDNSEMDKDNTDVLYGRERLIRERTSCGIIGTIVSQEVTDENNCKRIVSVESLLPIHDTTVGGIETTEIVQKESLFSAQEKTDGVKCLDIELQESLPSIHEATLTKADNKTNHTIQNESSLGTQQSTDRVQHLNNISEESILSTNNKDTKTSQFQKERRVSFMLESNQLNKRVSLNKRKSGRKSILINTSCNSGKISTSINKQTNMSKSAFSLDSLVFEEESENRASGSAFLDLHASKGATGSLNSNSAFSQQSTRSKNASEQDNSYFNSRSTNNDYASKGSSGIESEQSSTMEEKEDSSYNENEKEQVEGGNAEGSEGESLAEKEDEVDGSSLIEEHTLQYEEDSSNDEDEEEQVEGGNVEVSEGESLADKEDEVDGGSLIEEHTLQYEEDSSNDEDEEEHVEGVNVEGSEGESLVDEVDGASLIEEHTGSQYEEEDSSHDEDEELVEGVNVEESEERSLVEKEDEGSLIEDHTLENEKDEEQFNESMDIEGEPNQVENITYGEGEREKDNSEMESLQTNVDVECIIKKKNENPEYLTLNNPLKENKKKGKDFQQLFKKPLPKKPINKRKIREILDNIPLSELKKKKRRVSNELEKSNSFKSREQMLQDEIEEALLKNINRKTTQVGFTKANKLKIPRKWVTPKMYNFIISKLQPTFGLKARVRAENVVLFLAEQVDCVMRSDSNYFDLVEEIKAELARLEIIHSHWDFYKLVIQFFDGLFIQKIFYGEISNPFEPNDVTESIL